MKIKRSDVYEFYQVLSVSEFDMPISTQFRYMLSKNLKKAKAEIDETDALFPSPDKYEQYFTARKESYEKYGISLLSDGRPDAEAISKLSDEEKASLNDSVDAVLAKYDSVTKQVKLLNTEKEQFLDEEIEIAFETVKLENIPSISATQVSGINHWVIWRLIELVVA